MTTNNNDINVAQRNSQDLTEKWKKGKLEFGKEYYVRFEDGEISTAQWCYYTNQDRYGFDVDEVKEVLAPVPSYGDCLINETLIKDLSKKVNKLIEENNKLKELLKECRDGLEKIKHIGETKKLGAVYQVAERTLAKIDEVVEDENICSK